MSKRIPAATVAGKHTFWGCYLACKTQIIRERGWGENTVKEYESSYINKICASLKNHDQTPINQYARADYENAISTIQRQGYISDGGYIQQYDQSTIDRFHYLIQVVVETAADNYLCFNVFSETAPPKDSGGIASKRGKIIPRSISPQAEIRAAEELLTNPLQTGEYMGLAAMFCWGARNAEACGLNFGDIKLFRDIPGCWVVWVYKTTKIRKTELQASGKTKNADRVVALPDRYVQLVLARKQMLKELLPEGTDVDALPIACRGNDYFQRCSADDITQAAKKLFPVIGITQEQLCLANAEMQQAILEDDRNENGDPIDKDVTEYIFRRICATSMACVGLDEMEIASQIGHDMGTGLPETRNEFVNTQKLRDIKRKMDQRPIVNTLREAPKTVLAPPNNAIELAPSSSHQFVAPAGCTHIRMHISGNEPGDELRVAVTASDPSDNLSVTALQYDLPTEHHGKDLDVVIDYHEMYKKYL